MFNTNFSDHLRNFQRDLVGFLFPKSDVHSVILKDVNSYIIKTVFMIMKILLLYLLLYLVNYFVFFKSYNESNQILEGKYLESGASILLYYINSYPFNIIFLFLFVIIIEIFVIMISYLTLFLLGEKKRFFSLNAAILIHSSIYFIVLFFPILISNTFLNLSNSISFLVTMIAMVFWFALFLIACFFSAKFYISMSKPILELNTNRAFIAWITPFLFFTIIVLKAFSK